MIKLIKFTTVYVRIFVVNENAKTRYGVRGEDIKAVTVVVVGVDQFSRSFLLLVYGSFVQYDSCHLLLTRSYHKMCKI